MPSGDLTLIIFEENPERLTYVLVPHDGNVALNVRTINGLMMNGDQMTDAQEKVFEKFSNWMTTEKGLSCQFKSPISNVHIVEVLHTGFVM